MCLLAVGMGWKLYSDQCMIVYEVVHHIFYSILWRYSPYSILFYNTGVDANLRKQSIFEQWNYYHCIKSVPTELLSDMVELFWPTLLQNCRSVAPWVWYSVQNCRWFEICIFCCNEPIRSLVTKRLKIERKLTVRDNSQGLCKWKKKRLNI